MINKLKSLWKEKMPKIIGSALNVLALLSQEYAGKVLLNAISRPRKGKIESYQKKFLAKAEIINIDCDGFEVVTYHWRGTGKKILLCHGWESNSWRWRKLVAALLKENYYVIALDGPAHGASGSPLATTPLYASFIHQALRKFEVEVLIGHSFGGYSSLYSLSHMGNPGISYLIILASPDRWVDIAAAFFDAIGASAGLKKGLDRAFIEKYGFPQDYYNASDFAANIEVKGMLIHDGSDSINKVTDGRNIASKWKNCKYFETEGLGHGLQSPVVFDMVIEYLKTN